MSKLRAARLNMEIRQARAKLETANARAAELKARREEMQKRETNLAEQIEEVNAETSAEDREAVDALTAEYEKDDAALEAEEMANAQERAELERQISDAESELNELNERAQRAVTVGAQMREGNGESRNEERGDMRMRDFFGMNYEQRKAFFAQPSVKNFLTSVRAMGGKRDAGSITGVEVTLPVEILEILRPNIERFSKLIRHVRVVNAGGGKERLPIMGEYPQAVWTEQCGALNQLGLTFSAIEIEGYKVGGFIPICNALLEDSDIDLGAEIVLALGASIGLGLDMAIVYGTGIKMPLGIVPRLMQTSAPAEKFAHELPWQDVHTTNVITIPAGTNGLPLFQQLVQAAGAVKGKYARGTKFWVMNEYTYTQLRVQAMSITAAGQIVTGMDRGEMPVVGGVVEVLEFMPDNVIVGGFGELYTLAERRGTYISRSTDYMFVEDMTVYKGTARYDGKPVIANAFVAIGINGVQPSATSVTFAPDAANDTNAALATLTLTGATLAPAFAPAVLTYSTTVADESLTVAATAKHADKGATVVATLNGEAVALGAVTLKPGANVLTLVGQYGTSAMTYTVNITYTPAEAKSK